MSISTDREHGAVSRRTLLTGGLGVAALVGGGVVGAGIAGRTDDAPSTSTTLGPPSSRDDQPPAFYRIAVGDFVVTAISDGSFPLDAEQAMIEVDRARVRELLDDSFLTTTVESSYNAFLIDTGRRRVLVDTGNGQLGPSTSGRLVTNLAAAGYRPRDVDVVVFTHLHLDHVGGLVRDGRAVFPASTRIMAERTEAAYWLSAAEARRASEANRPFFVAARTAFAPYRDRLETFRAGDAIVPGVTVVDAAGHTPGHVGFQVDSGSDRLRIWGDVVHLGEVQFPEPSAAIAFDVDPAAAVARRQAILADVARERLLVAGAHLPFPGIGHVRRVGEGYQFLPVNYASSLGPR